MWNINSKGKHFVFNWRELNVPAKILFFLHYSPCLWVLHTYPKPWSCMPATTRGEMWWAILSSLMVYSECWSLSNCDKYPKQKFDTVIDVPHSIGFAGQRTVHKKLEHVCCLHLHQQKLLVFSCLVMKTYWNSETHEDYFEKLPSWVSRDPKDSGLFFSKYISSWCDYFNFYKWYTAMSRLMPTVPALRLLLVPPTSDWFNDFYICKALRHECFPWALSNVLWVAHKSWNANALCFQLTADPL